MSDDESSMDDRQRRISNALVERERSDLAGMYRSALDLLATTPDAGNERTRISYICHSMREVMNRVLGVMGSSASPRIKPSTAVQVQALPDVVAQYPELTLDAESESVPVPQAVAAMFDKLIKTAVQEKRRSRDHVAALLTDDGNSDHAAVKRWVEARDFFVDWTHLEGRQRQESELPNDDDIREHIDVFEELLDGVITRFFALRHSIDDLLAEINAQVTESGDE
jgi:hypothetical protein